jgi:hypothetical protein|tara:strand:- start:1348 stop:1713 length:366 start_codon:yes stop_codon:yes gene_type:complete
MKISQLKKIIKEAVKEAIQEEMKDILLEAVKVPKTIVETKKSTTPQFEQQKPLTDGKKKELRENMMNVLNGMMPGANGTLSATSADVPLQVNGPMDTTSANGTLPAGNVSMDQIMGLMNSK